MVIVLILVLLLALLELFIISSAFFGFLRTRVPFVPTSKDDIAFIAKELKFSAQDVFYDLGSGNGKVVFLVEELTGARAKGFELTWWTHLWAKIKRVVVRSNAQFINKNFFSQDWSEATVVYGYLYPPLMARVEEKFLKDCRPGALAIIRDFPFPRLKPERVYNRPHSHEIYVYRIVDKS